MSRVLLVANPNATSTSKRVRNVIASAISSRAPVEVATTTHRNHATELAQHAVDEGFDAVFTLGGDGTVNEVIQALAGTDVALGILSGGSTNVLARALGLPKNPYASVRRALSHLSSGTDRRIGLGQANDRWFGFMAGYGFDASVVREVEANPQLKRRIRQGAFVWLTARTWFSEDQVHDPSIEVTIRGRSTGPYGMAMLGNTSRYTYLGPVPLKVTPSASFERGLDLVAVGEVSTFELLRILARVFTTGTHDQYESVDQWHDLDAVELTSSKPLPLIVDGDHIGDHAEVSVRSVRNHLRVLA